MTQPTTLPAICSPRLTAHAVARFRERFFDASPETIAAYVLTPRTRAWLAAGATLVWRPEDDMTIVAEGGRVATVMRGRKRR